MVKNHMMSNDEKTFDECNMCNNTMKITLLHNCKKGSKINAVDGQGLAISYDRPIQG